MLPTLAGVVPVEAKLRQLLANLGGGNLAKLNPNPLANNLGNVKKARRFLPQQSQQIFCFQCSVCVAQSKVNLRQLLCVKLFGSALESRFLILCFRFHGLFFVFCCSVSVCRPSRQKAAKQGGQRE